MSKMQDELDLAFSATKMGLNKVQSIVNSDTYRFEHSSEDGAALVELRDHCTEKLKVCNDRYSVALKKKAATLDLRSKVIHDTVYERHWNKAEIYSEIIDLITKKLN